MRYPVFLLAFGPPIFRSEAIDATKGVIDIWSFFQVGLLAAIAIRAIYRLVSAESILIPKQVRSILKLAFLLGLLYLASAVYSSSRIVTSAYSVLYLLTLICVVEFVADAYKDPPDWIQCLFHLRLIALLLLAVVILTLPFAPSMVFSFVEGAGIRLLGGAVAPVPVICPIIEIISVYSFLHSLESKGRSVLFFLVGLAGTLITQSRGSELSLLLSLAILGAGWAKTGKKPAYFFISSLMASILIFGAAVGAIGGGRIWSIVNRGQSSEGIASASGRTDIWKFTIQYCMAHPQGMGYVAGFRTKEREYFASGSLSNLTVLGNAHNTYFQVLADAGWLALAVYLLMLAKLFALGRKFLRRPTVATAVTGNAAIHAIRCALLLLIFCLAEGMDGADFCVPLREPFYLQNIVVAIILGISARLLVAFRTRYHVTTG
jgi:O-antigen ligase